MSKFDKAFSNGKWAVNVETVGHLIRELRRLPKAMMIKTGATLGADLVIFNRDMETLAHLSLEEGGRWVTDRENPEDDQRAEEEAEERRAIRAEEEDDGEIGQPSGLLEDADKQAFDEAMRKDD